MDDQKQEKISTEYNSMIIHNHFYSCNRWKALHPYYISFAPYIAANFYWPTWLIPIYPSLGKAIFYLFSIFILDMDSCWLESIGTLRLISMAPYVLARLQTTAPRNRIFNLTISQKRIHVRKAIMRKPKCWKTRLTLENWMANCFRSLKRWRFKWSR